MADIKEAIHGALTLEWESMNVINKRAGKFAFYMARQALEDLIKENKAESYQVRKRMKYRRTLVQMPINVPQLYQEGISQPNQLNSNGGETND